MNISLDSIIKKEVDFSEGQYNIDWHFLSIPLKVWQGEIPGSPGSQGVYDTNHIQISLNKIVHSTCYKINRLTVEGVIIHEFCHMLQYASNLSFEEGWFNLYENKDLTFLYKKYEYDFTGFYASKNPYEACAEVFRSILERKNKDEKWENNVSLLRDYILFFEKQKFFREFVENKFKYIRRAGFSIGDQDGEW